MKVYSIKTLFIISLLLFSLFSIWQSVEINPIGGFNAVCPGPQSHVLTATPDANIKCTYEWTVTNGIIDNNGETTYTGGNIISVTWANTTSNGTVKVVLINSDRATYENITNSSTFQILSVSGITLGSITAATTQVPFNSGSQTYSVPKLKYPNLGSNDGDKYVDSYKWKIPQGWSLNGQVSNGNTVYEGQSESITVIPNATSSGPITVWGHSDCGSGYDSNPSTISISRVFPSDLAITTTTSNDYYQGNKTPITYSVPNWSSATYSWS